MVTSKKLSPLFSVTGSVFQDLLFMVYPKRLAGKDWAAKNLFYCILGRKGWQIKAGFIRGFLAVKRKALRTRSS
jgi:hypothetical protein